MTDDEFDAMIDNDNVSPEAIKRFSAAAQARFKDTPLPEGVTDIFSRQVVGDGFRGDIAII